MVVDVEPEMMAFRGAGIRLYTENKTHTTLVCTCLVVCQGPTGPVQSAVGWEQGLWVLVCFCFWYS